jgi:hypothetical protein
MNHHAQQYVIRVALHLSGDILIHASELRRLQSWGGRNRGCSDPSIGRWNMLGATYDHHVLCNFVFLQR